MNMERKLFSATASGVALLLLGAQSEGQSLTLIGPGVAEAISADGTTVVGWDLEPFVWTEGSGQTFFPGNFAKAVSADGSIVLGE